MQETLKQLENQERISMAADILGAVADILGPTEVSAAQYLRSMARGLQFESGYRHISLLNILEYNDRLDNVRGAINGLLAFPEEMRKTQKQLHDGQRLIGAAAIQSARQS